MNKEDKIKHLQEIIQIHSENENEVEVAKYYQNLLNKHGIESELVEYSPTRTNLVAEIKGEEPGKVLVLSGHMDVVAAGDEKDWAYPPYGAVIDDGKRMGEEQLI